MRTYGQFCGIAKALDLIGDRWTLLIVRELLALGPSRHTDLRNGLPGIASNLLVDRLRELEEAGLIRREAAPPPVATTLFTLTDRGRELDSVLRELSRWGVPLLHESPGMGTFRTHWLAQPARALTDRTPVEPPVAIQLHAEDNEDLVLEVNHGVVHTHPGRVDEPAATLTGPPKVLTALLTGGLSLHDAELEGLQLAGELDAVRRILPDR
ncbi:winged helix-turn-helix transcriptional regulator [Winogradskya consettensis]|uniref:Transcriptional regulator n=1 Tax=Winogradskya consettensis TaxID=113560 RepID=A0A919VQ84_9ACTN|nr:helix-turn-helix domain-containing protein [Actinoplanes consettensis]GIM72251.1 transcriptional regulator [Actinoplanes consettensis]